MYIKEMFEKKIDRDIKGVIKVGQKDDEEVYQELNEYIVTNELLKHFREFFESYKKGIGNYTDDMGVWISGFFGSGKSHFLKILSYILENREVEGKKAIDFFKEKIFDSTVLADMAISSSVSSDVILFNIDAKSSSSNKNPILDVFLKVFNEFQGFSSGHLFLADFERRLSKEGIYDNFKDEFRNINGDDWESQREGFLFIQDDVIETITKIGYMSKESAQNWAEKADDNYELTIEGFSNLIKEYLETKGTDHHIVFLVDEIGQYIGDNSKLMLNLQTLTEELGINCKGKAWIVVTSQEAIDSIVKVKGDDFSKIQGRFKTRLSLSSANVDEVIRKRILAKNETAKKTLIAFYEEKESILKNLIHFRDSAEMKIYSGSTDFAEVYPFIPYQFNLLGNVLKAIREHGASGKHLSEGERSMLALFQESAIEVMNNEEGSLSPFNIFYNPLDRFIDSSHSSVISKARNNNNLDDFDVEVLKVLFLIKYVKEITATLENLATLLVDNIEVDRVELNNKIGKSLNVLENETLIQKNGEIYTFLTNEEQDINAAIKHEHVEIGEVQNKVSEIIFDDIFPEKRFSYNNRYNFDFNKAVDGRYKGNKQGGDIGVNVITSYYDLDFNNDSPEKQLISNDDTNEQRNLQAMSENKEIIINIRKSSNFLKEIEEYLKIEKYTIKNGATLSNNYKHILDAKKEEINQKRERAKLFIATALEDGDIYIDGSKSNMVNKNPNLRIKDALKNLVEKVYFKLETLKKEPNESNIKDVLLHPQNFQNTHIVAVDDLYDFIDRKCEDHQRISLKSVFDNFNKAPYGFIDLDIIWLISNLLSKKSIYLYLNNKPITTKNYTPDEIIRFLKEKKNREKIIIDKKVSIPKTQIKAVKNILKEFFHTPNTNEDDEELKELFIEKMNEYDIDFILRKYNEEKRFPGKDVIEKVKELFKDIKYLNTTKEFFDFINQREDEFLDLNDDLKSINTFFDGSQKDIFKETCKIIDEFEKNKEFISSKDLISTIESMKNIIGMENPIPNIFKLPELNNSFKETNKQIVNAKKEEVKKIIDNNKKEIIQKLYSPQLKAEFENKVNNDFEIIKNNTNETNDISKILAFQTKSENLKNRFKSDIERFFENKKSPDDPKPIPKTVQINIKEIFNAPIVSFKNDEEINEFIDSLKQNLKDKLKEIDEKGYINLKF